METPVAIVSPHLDDAVLSCWHLLAGAGEVGVVNVFTGSPAAGEPAWWDAFTGATNSVARMRARLEEDREALSLVGRRAHNLGFLDEQYAPERQTVAAIAESLAAAIPEETLVAAPAAITNLGTDHTRVCDAARELRARGYAVCLYADYPHALRLGWPSWVSGSSNGRVVDGLWTQRLAELNLDARADAEVVSLEPAEKARKLEAISSYRTQMPGLRRMFGAIAGFPAFEHEIVWRLPGT